MMYSKAKLKGNGDRTSPCFKPFLIRSMSEKCSPAPSLLWVSCKHIFISLVSFTRIQNSVTVNTRTRSYLKLELAHEIYLKRNFEIWLVLSGSLAAAPIAVTSNRFRRQALMAYHRAAVAARTVVSAERTAHAVGSTDRQDGSARWGTQPLH